MMMPTFLTTLMLNMSRWRRCIESRTHSVTLWLRVTPLCCTLLSVQIAGGIVGSFLIFGGRHITHVACDYHLEAGGSGFWQASVVFCSLCAAWGKPRLPEGEKVAWGASSSCIVATLGISQRCTDWLTRWTSGSLECRQRTSCEFLGRLAGSTLLGPAVQTMMLHPRGSVRRVLVGVLFIWGLVLRNVFESC